MTAPREPPGGTVPHRRSAHRSAAAVTTALALAALAGGARSAGLPSYWPHAPGASWTYDRVRITWSAAHKTTFDGVRFDLADSIVVGPSVVVQPLTVTAVTGEVSAPEFWRQLCLARPGASIPTPAGSSSGVAIHDATLLHVGSDAVAGYRADLGIRSWLYLEPDLSPGHTLHLQLVPDLADSVFLDGVVVGAADISTPAGSFAGALRVRYDIDFGWADAVDSLGSVVGRVRAHTRGEIFYAPEVGPVLARETFIPAAATQGSPPPATADSTFAELRLQSYSLHPTAVTRAAWSAIKRRYR